MGFEITMNNPSTTLATDPYAEIIAPRDFEGAFKPSFYLKMYFLIVLIMIVGTGLGSFVSFLNEEYFSALYALLFCFFIEWYIIRRIPNYVSVSPRGLELRFLFSRKRNWLNWPQIRSLKIFQGRGTWGELRTQEGVFHLALESSGFQDARVLVKLITENASLNFAKGKAFNDAYYNRAENKSDGLVT